jgi:hypothetical protein
MCVREENERERTIPDVYFILFFGENKENFSLRCWLTSGGIKRNELFVKGKKIIFQLFLLILKLF